MKLDKKLLALATLIALSSPTHAAVTVDVIGGSEVSFEGNIQFDGNWFDSDVANLNGSSIDGDDTDFNVRRAEFVLKGKGPGMWSWVVGYDAHSDKFLDTNIQYKFGADTVLTVGQYKQPNSLEELSSSKNNDFIAKAMTTNLFGMSRRTGVQLATGSSNWGVAGSVFGNELTRLQSPSLGTGQGYGMRGYFLPINESGNIVHLGLSYVDMEARDATGDNRARLRVRPNADLAGVRLIDSGQFTNADRLKTTGIEGAWVNGPVRLQAEWMGTTITRSTSPDYSADSWYVYGVYNLTGESWTSKGGTLGTVLPDNPASGMWQIGLRYDYADLNDGTVFGGKESNWTLGANWYWRSNFKLSANYVMVDSERGAIPVSDNPNIFEMRAQFHW